MRRPSTALWLFLGYGVFVVYGSLVPLEYKALSLEEAWARFQHVPFLNLGLGSRAPDLYDELILDGAFLGEAFLHARPPLDAPGLTVLGQTPTFRARPARGASPR